MRKQLLATLLWTPVCLMADNSPFISKVLEYRPAPGQFMNTLTSGYEEGYDEAQVLKRVQSMIATPYPSGFVSLGAWGGYIVVGFDHTVVNVAGAYDFKIHANAFAGSAEPGIVMVSRDTNGNGIADDPWYELAGSEFGNPEVIKGYEVTYYRPEQEADDVVWRDNKGGNGVIAHNQYHPQAYYPEWISGDLYTLAGCRLPDNARWEEDRFVLDAFPWGYADNHPNASSLSDFKIDWAVDASGNPVKLAGIDFVKVYTGELQVCGWIGETSTEFCNVEDLHPDEILSEDVSSGALEAQSQLSVYPTRIVDRLYIRNGGESSSYRMMNASGVTVASGVASEGVTTLSLRDIPSGMYLFRWEDERGIHTVKLVK